MFAILAGVDVAAIDLVRVGSRVVGQHDDDVPLRVLPLPGLLPLATEHQ